jgi:hypothetical protein
VVLPGVREEEGEEVKTWWGASDAIYDDCLTRTSKKPFRKRGPVAKKINRLIRTLLAGPCGDDFATFAGLMSHAYRHEPKREKKK